MKNLKKLMLFVGFFSFAAVAQETPLEDLPTATLTENYLLTLDPSVPVSEYYVVDISHMGYANEAEAIQQCRAYLTSNLLTNEVHFSENYMIVHIHTEYMGGDLSYEKIQTYLNQLSKSE